jgi:hypothetical protein
VFYHLSTNYARVFAVSNILQLYVVLFQNTWLLLRWSEYHYHYR